MIRLPFRASKLLVLVAFTATGIVSAQNTGHTNGQRITPSFKDAEIGQVIGVGESRVSQLRTQAIARLRSLMREWLTSLETH